MQTARAQSGCPKNYATPCILRHASLIAWRSLPSSTTIRQLISSGNDREPGKEDQSQTHCNSCPSASLATNLLNNSSTQALGCGTATIAATRRCQDILYGLNSRETPNSLLNFRLTLSSSLHLDERSARNEPHLCHIGS